jgi:hypothetical protein
MNKPETEIVRKGIIVIQSLGDYDRKTGKELYHDILQYKQYSHEDSFVKFNSVSTKDEFLSMLNTIYSNMQEGDIFTLHIETHGSNEGIHLSSGDVVTWIEFSDTIRPINIKMGHLLVVVMAMCKGTAFVMGIKPEERAPYRAFIASPKNVPEDDIARGFSAFYNEYYNVLDISAAMNALKNEIGDTFELYTAEWVFDKVFDPDRYPAFFNSMVTNIFNEKRIADFTITIEKVREDIRDILLKTREHRDYYCFVDLYN